MEAEVPLAAVTQDKRSHTTAPNNRQIVYTSYYPFHPKSGQQQRQSEAESILKARLNHVYGGHRYRRSMLETVKPGYPPVVGDESTASTHSSWPSSAPFTGSFLFVPDSPSLEVDVDLYTVYESLAWKLVQDKIRE